MVSFVLKPIFQTASEGDKLSFSITIVNPNYKAISEYKIYYRTHPTQSNAASSSDYSEVYSLKSGPFSAKSFHAADGNDRFIAAPQNGLIQGGSDNELLRGGAGPDQINGGAGNDILLGFGDVDSLDGGTQDDELYGDIGNDGLVGGDGNDRGFGWTGNDTLNGGLGNDRLAGEDGNDNVTGGDGDDTLFGDRDTAPLAHSGQEIINLTMARIGAGDFAILYQGPSYTESGLRASPHDLIIINPARLIDPEVVNSEQLWTAAQVNGIEATGKRLIGYLNVSKINDFVDYWDPAWTTTGDAEGAPRPNPPAFLGADDPNYDHTRLINYWASGWKELLAERVETIVAQGFSGIFLDDVLAYYTRRGGSLAEIAQAAREMRDLVIYLADVAWDAVFARDGSVAAAANFTVIVNGAPFIISDTTADESAYDGAKANAYYGAIDAFLAENYFSEFNRVGIAKAVAEFGSRGIALLSVDSAITSDNYRILIERAAIDAGFLPEVVAAAGYGTDTTRFRTDFADSPAPGVDILDGGPGNDLLDGGGGADTMRGGPGNDVYIVDNIGDLVEENAASGTDEVRTSIASYSIAALANIENLTGTSSSGQTLSGNSGNNIITGGAGPDFVRVNGGGNDTVLAGSGDDIIFFIATLTSADALEGGAGADTIVLQGNYSGGLALSANITGIEAVTILGGNNTSFGEPGTNLYDYVITTNNVNFAAGIQARINGAALLAGEDFTFNGSAETDAKFVVYGGKGVDTLTGGFGNDVFIYAEDRFAPGDTVNGGPGGYDGIFLRGNYTIDFNAPGYFGLLTSIENMTLTSITDERYARGGDPAGFDYNITLADNQLLAGVELTVSGTYLTSGETMVVDGSLETDGNFRFFAGRADDVLKGGANNDLLLGYLGADTLTGGGGADTFRYDTTADSNSASMDHILDFTPGTDKIDLGRTDANTLVAGDQAFTWIGSNAFSNVAGQLRAFQQGGEWILQGDTNGDGIADLVIALTLQGPTPLGAGDFML